MKRRLVSIILAVILSVSMLAGCAGNSEDVKENKDSTEVSGSEQTDQEDTEETEDTANTENPADAEDNVDVTDEADQVNENAVDMKYTADCCEVFEFEIIEDRLVVRTEGEEPISIGYPLSSDCIWYRCYVGNEDEVSESMSFEEVKEHVEAIRQDEKDGVYTCWNGLGIQVQNNKVTRVYIIAQ